MSLLPDTAHRVDDAVARAQAAGRVPSLAAAVIRDGVTAHFAAAGERVQVIEIKGATALVWRS